MISQRMVIPLPMLLPWRRKRAVNIFSPLYETVSTFLHRPHSMTFKKKMLMRSSIWYV